MIQEDLAPCIMADSYDPWASCLCHGYVEVCYGFSRSIEVSWLLLPSCYGFVHSDWRCSPYFNRGAWRNSKYGGHHAWPLLENCSPDPPPQVLPSLDALRWRISAVVERGCSAFATRHRHDQNCQRKVQPNGILANYSHGKGMPTAMRTLSSVL